MQFTMNSFTFGTTYFTLYIYNYNKIAILYMIFFYHDKKKFLKLVLFIEAYTVSLIFNSILALILVIYFHFQTFLLIDLFLIILYTSFSKVSITYSMKKGIQCLWIVLQRSQLILLTKTKVSQDQNLVYRWVFN